MRPISEDLKARILKAHQTIYENAEPRIWAEVLRPRTAIFNKRFWQESIITKSQAADLTSIAAKRTGEYTETVFAAYVKSGNLTVKSSNLVFPVNNMLWETRLTRSGIAHAALCFDGYYKRKSRYKVDFFTGDLPYLFTTDAGGKLEGGVLGEDPQTIVAGNVTAFDATRGIASEYGNIDHGVVVFYIIDGDVFYRHLIDGQWSDQEQVEIAPAGAAKVHVSRVFDWRYVLQVETTAGKVFEVFSRQYYSGWVGVEKLSATVSGFKLEVHEVNQVGAKLAEQITASVSGFSVAALWAVQTDLVYAENVSFTDLDQEIEDDYGYKILASFAHGVSGVEDDGLGFKLVDEDGAEFGSVSVLQTSERDIEIIFQNFNNASGTVSLVYTDPTAKGEAGQAIATTSVDFLPTGLVPSIVVGPEPVDVWNTDEQTILIEFDKNIVSIGSQDGFVVSGQEPLYAPAGPLALTEYEIDSIAATVDPKVIQINLTYDGRLKHPQSEITIDFDGTIYGPGGSLVEPFSEVFEAEVDPVWFNPGDPEQLTATVSAFSLTVSEVTSHELQTTGADNHLTATVGAFSVTVTKVGDLPL